MRAVVDTKPFVITTTWAPLYPLVTNNYPCEHQCVCSSNSNKRQAVVLAPSQILYEDTSSASFNQASACAQPNVTRNIRKHIVWTEELHQIFLTAISKLGLNATPAKLLRAMNVPGLTRENVASHLQKFRMRKRVSKELEQFAENYKA